MSVSEAAPEPASKLVKALKEAVAALERGDENAQEDVSKNLVLINNMLFGTSELEPQTDNYVAELSQELYNSNLLLLLIQNLNRIAFKGKKDVARVFNNLLRRRITSPPSVEYIRTEPEILFTLMSGYGQHENALIYGTMLFECARYEALAKIMLHSDEFFNFFRYVDVLTLDIASDAFDTFKELLTRHKMLCAEFLVAKYDQVFTHYQQLLESENYVTRRQSLKLLGQLLLDGHNFTVMTRYISNPANLELIILIFLQQESYNIRAAALDVIQVFVKNPNKPKPILDILVKNKNHLLAFLNTYFETKPIEPPKPKKPKKLTKPKKSEKPTKHHLVELIEKLEAIESNSISLSSSDVDIETIVEPEEENEENKEEKKETKRKESKKMNKKNENQRKKSQRIENKKKNPIAYTKLTFVGKVREKTNSIFVIFKSICTVKISDPILRVHNLVEALNKEIDLFKKFVFRHFEILTDNELKETLTEQIKTIDIYENSYTYKDQRLYRKALDEIVRICGKMISRMDENM